MSVTCDENAEALTYDLGFDCHDVAPVVSVRNPFDLAHWTQPVLELLVIAGAIFALVLAVQRLRGGDPINISLWFGSLAYLAITEPPLYFPEWFGLDQIYGFIFAHNQFTVQFMYDRLPLYIIAFYPAIITLAYEVVRGLGVFAHRGAFAGAVCVAFVSQVFYEIFDHLGPELGWWAWNQDNQIVNHPMMAEVPMTSMVLFASVSMGFLAYLVVRWIGTEHSGWSLVWRTVVAGVITPIGMVVANIPASLFGGDTPNVTAQAWALGIELALIWLAGAWLVYRSEGGAVNRLAALFPAAFLLLHAAMWLATGSTTSAGWYVVLCFVAAAAILVKMFVPSRVEVS